MNSSLFCIRCTEILHEEIKIEDALGEGVQGKTYIAQYKGGKFCAKIFRQFSEYQREATMISAAELSSYSPKLVGTCSGMCLILMELAPGITLQRRIKNKPCRISVHKILFALGKAIDSLHFSGIIHNDLKVDNIMVTLDDTNPIVTLIDFGWATFNGESPYPHISPEAINTFKHVSPKLASGGESNAGTDNYSYGLILRAVGELYNCQSLLILAAYLTKDNGIVQSVGNLMEGISFSGEQCMSCRLSCSCQNCTRYKQSVFESNIYKKMMENG